MKTRLLAVALFLFTITAIGQTQKEMEAGAQAVYTNTVKGNYEELLNDTYPKIFDIVPREKMLEVLKMMIDGDGYSMVIMDVPPNFKYGPIKKIAGASYCLITHDLGMKMIFDEKMTKEEADLMLDTFKQAMNTEQVSFNEAENAVIILKKADIIAVADSLTGNKWKYVNRSGSPMMKKIFSEEVLKAFGL